MSKLKKSWIIAVIVLGILVFTNPTNKDLESYMSAKRFDYNKKRGGRIYYFGIFSIFKANVGSDFQNPNRIYLGIFKNFICVKSES